MATTERLSPLSACEEAAALLRAAWNPPCVHYSAEYLAWQLSFPGPEPLAVGAVEANGSLSGFAAATPRRLRLGTVTEFAYLVSFVAVHPEYQGQGLAARLYAALLAEIARTGRPVVTFAAEGTAGERALRRAYPEAGWSLTLPIPYTVHGGFPRPTTRTTRIETSPAPETVASLVTACAAQGVLWSAPDATALLHYAAGPGRKVIRVDTSEGVPLGAGIVASAEFVTEERIRRSSVVEAFFCPDPTLATEALSTLCHHAFTLGSPVLFYNLQGVDAAVLRAVGLRRAPSPFHAFLAAPKGAEHPFLQATATSLEIV